MNPFNRNTIHHLIQCLILMLGVSGPVQIIVASESAAVQWSTVRHVWGEDLSGSLQGAGGIGGLLSTRFTPTQDSPSPISDLPSSARGAFMHYDSNGNIILLTGAQANESARYAYDAFGKALTATGPAAKANRYRFSTKPAEEESGLVYYGYRYYDPVTGRWPSRDPIEEMGGVNLYASLYNDAINLVDKDGRVVQLVMVAFGLTKAGINACFAAITCYHCNSCLNEAFEWVAYWHNKLVVEMGHDTPFLNYMATNPAGHCADMCGDCGNYALRTVIYLVGSVMLKYGTRLNS